MNIYRKKEILLGILLCGLVIIIYLQLRDSNADGADFDHGYDGGEQVHPLPPEYDPFVNALADNDRYVVLSRHSSTTADTTTIRNPFRRPAQRKAGRNGIQGESHTMPVLSGIVWAPGSPRAVIDGAIVQQGDVVAGYRIVQITRQSVVMRGSSKSVTLALSAPKKENR